jgi:hypothetical protein
VNPLIWEGMKIKHTTKAGFDLTDTNSDGKITRAEDTNANILANKFKNMDTYTPGVPAVAANPTAVPPVVGVPAKVPDEKANGQLDRWELNLKYPMWEVDTMLKTYGNAKSYLDML